MKRRAFIETLGGAIALAALGKPQLSASIVDRAKPVSNQNLLSELRVQDGRLILFIDGQKHDGLFCSVTSQYMRNFIEAGFDIFDARDIPHGWIDDGKYDFAATDNAIDAFLNQKPDAKLIVRCGWYPRDFWWILKHPEEAAVPRVRGKKQQMPSYASLRWRQESAEALRRFAQHTTDKYGSSVIAYVPDAGEPGEWFTRFAYCEDADRFTKGYPMGDYSEPMQQAYRRFVLNKYGNLAEVNKLYRTAFKTPAEITIPDVTRRLNANLGHLRQVDQEQPVIDFFEVLNREVYQTLVHYARKVKEGCSRTKLVFVFFGYHWLEQPRGGVSQARSGHVHLDEVLSSPDVDALISPYQYDFRQTEGVMSSQAPVSSILRRNKQFIHECDGSTYLKPCWPCPDHNNPANAAESGKLLRRDLSRPLMDGSFMWFMDLVGGMYDSPEMVTELRQTLRVGRKVYWNAGRNNHQVAVVLHSRDAFYQREGEPLRAPLIPQFKQYELERIGLGYDDLMLENLQHLDAEQTAQYRLWIFPTAVRLSDNELRLIKQHCCRNGNYVLWAYAPGILGSNGIDVTRTEHLTGFKLGYTLEPGEVAIRSSSPQSPYLKERISPTVYGTYGELGPDFIRYHSSLRHYPGTDVGFSITPRFYILNADVVLGRILDLPGEPVGLGVKTMGNWTSVMSTAPLVPKHIIRNIAECAGCHVYTDFLGQTYHSSNYIGFFAHDTGNCLIRFPSPSRVTDVFRDDAILGDGVDSIQVSVQANDAILLHYVPLSR